MPVAKGAKMPNYPKERKRKELPTLVGLRYGRLVVIAHAGYDKYQRRTWLCHCDCKNEVVVRGLNLRTGNTVSCGCFGHEVRRQNGYKLPHTRLELGVSSRNAVISCYKKRALKSQRPYMLLVQQAEALFISNCHYCGRPPSNTSSTRKSNGSYEYSGIDRIDNSKGYEDGNVVPCCKRCNIAKNDMTHHEFKEWISIVYKNLWRKTCH